MPRINCTFTIGHDWDWNSGPAIGGQHNEFPTQFKTLYSTIDIPEPSDMWYSLQLAVWPSVAYGYGFVKYDNGHVYCKVMSIGRGEDMGVGSATIDGLTVVADLQ